MAPFDHCLRLTDLGRRKRRTTTKTFPTALGRGKPGDCSFPYYVPLELRDGTEDGIEHTAGSRTRIDMVSQRT
jgi:hypothetical protein